MSFRLAVTYAAAGVVAACLASGEARAQANVLKECGSKYQAAKAANELKGQSWQDFLKACKVGLAESAAPAAAPAPAAEAPKPVEAPKAEAPAPAAPVVNPLKPAPAAPVTAAPAAKDAKPASAGQAAARERQKKCGEEWKAQKAELKKKNPKASWPKFWSECNTRLKAAGE